MKDQRWRVEVRGAPQRQRGVALVISLVLLVLVTLVGLASVRGTVNQQKMVSNLYDREIAFQDAEAALNAAIATYDADPKATDLVWHNCQDGSASCIGNPFEDSNLPSANVHTLSTGNTETSYTANGLAAGQPQFVLEEIGAYASSDSNAKATTSAELEGIDQISTGATSTYIRVTARNADPESAAADGRAIVTLQGLFKR